MIPAVKNRGLAVGPVLRWVDGLDPDDLSTPSGARPEYSGVGIVNRAAAM